MRNLSGGEHQIVVDLLTTNETYFFRQARKVELLQNVISALAPGGLLFVGHAEPLNALPLPLERIADAVFVKAG